MANQIIQLTDSDGNKLFPFNISHERYTVTPDSTSPFGWSTNIKKTGYIVIGFSVGHGWSSSIIAGYESYSQSTGAISGFCSDNEGGALRIFVDVWYVKVS